MCVCVCVGARDIYLSIQHMVLPVEQGGRDKHQLDHTHSHREGGQSVEEKVKVQDGWSVILGVFVCAGDSGYEGVQEFSSLSPPQERCRSCTPYSRGQLLS